MDLLRSALRGGDSGADDAPVRTPARSGARASAPSDMSKEDLLHLAMKVQKRLKSLQSKHAKLQEKAKACLSSRRAAESLVKRIVGAEGGDVELWTRLWEEKQSAAGLEREELLHAQEELQAERASSERRLAALRRQLDEMEARAVAAEERASEWQVRLLKGGAPAGSGSFSASAASAAGEGSTVAGGAAVEDEGVRVGSRGDGRVEELLARVQLLEAQLEEAKTNATFTAGSLTLLRREVEEKEAAWEKERSAARLAASRLSAASTAAEERARFAEEERARLSRVVEERTAAVEAAAAAQEAAGSRHEEALVFVQMQLAKAKKEADDAAQLRQRVAEKEAALSSLRAELSSKEEALAAESLRSAEADELRGQLSAAAMLSAEKTALSDDLRARCAAATEAAAAAESEAQRWQREATEARATVSSLQASLQDKSGMLSELEDRVAEWKQGDLTRSEEVSRLSTQLTAAKASLEERDAQLKASQAALLAEQLRVEELSTLSLQVEDLQAQLQLRDEQIAEAEEAKSAAAAAKEEEMAALRRELDEQLEAVRTDAQAKSKRARVMMESKEREVELLKIQTNKLKEEVRSGRPTDRRLLELAAKQAKREGELSRDARRIAMLEEELDDASTQLRLAREQETLLKAEFREMERCRSRESVDLEYLKNVVAQYMSLPAGSERAMLVPVIATLLQFSPAEVAAARAESTAGVSWWSSRSTPRKPKRVRGRG